MLGNITDPESTTYQAQHGAVSTAILAMVLNLAVQQKAQAKIDKAVGSLIGVIVIALCRRCVSRST